MDNNSSFIGIGKNPDPNVPDIPLGLGMGLAQDVAAMNHFSLLSPEDKTRVIKYVQSGQTGGEAKNRIKTAIDDMGHSNTNFLV